MYFQTPVERKIEEVTKDIGMHLEWTVKSLERRGCTEEKIIGFIEDFRNETSNIFRLLWDFQESTVKHHLYLLLMKIYWDNIGPHVSDLQRDDKYWSEESIIEMLSDPLKRAKYVINNTFFQLLFSEDKTPYEKDECDGDCEGCEEVI